MRPNVKNSFNHLPHPATQRPDGNGGGLHNGNHWANDFKIKLTRTVADLPHFASAAPCTICTGMIKTFAVGVCLVVAMSTASNAQTSEAVTRWEADRTIPLNAAEVELDDFKYVARPVLVFADSPNDAQFVQQMELFADRADELALRDVVVIFDTDPDARGDIRLRLRPRGFMLALMGKDGEIKARKLRPWDVRELTRSIDKMPMRQQEMQNRRRVNQ